MCDSIRNSQDQQEAGDDGRDCGRTASLVRSDGREYLPERDGRSRTAGGTQEEERRVSAKIRTLSGTFITDRQAYAARISEDAVKASS